MISLYVDIYYFAQLKRTDPSTIEALVARIQQILSNANGQSQSKHAPFLYTFDENIPGIRLQAAQASFSVFSELKTNHEKLFGFVMALDETDEKSADTALRAFKPLVLSLQADNNFLVGGGLADDFSEYFSYIDSGGIKLVEDFRFTHPVSADENQAFWERPSMMRFMLDALDPFFSGDSRKDFALFRGPRRGAAMRNLERALRPLAGTATIPLFRKNAQASNPYAEICLSIPASDLPIAAARLYRSERQVFESSRSAYEFLLKTPYKEKIPKEIERRFISFVGLYVRGFVRDRSARGLPALLLMEDIDSFSKQSKELAMRLPSFVEDGARPLVVGTLSSKANAGFDLERVSIIDLPDFDKSEIENYLKNIHGLDIGHGDDSAAPEYGQMMEAWIEDPLAFYHAFLAGKNSRTPTKKYLATLPSELLEILYVIVISDGILDRHCLGEYLSQSGRKPQSQQLAFKQLYQMGFLLSQESGQPSLEGLDAILKPILGQKADELDQEFFLYIVKLAGKGVLQESVELYQRACVTLKKVDVRALARTLSGEYAQDNCAALTVARESGFFKGIQALELQDRLCLDRWAAFLATFGSAAELESIVEALNSMPSDDECALLGQKNISRFYLEYEHGRSREALNWAKKALLSYQRSQDGLGEAQANRALGLCFLRSEQIYDAMDYFSNAYSIAEGISNDFEELLNSYYEALAYFLHGNYSRASRLAQRAQELASRCFRSDWEIQSLFFLARIEFELGRFENALARICQALAVDRLCQIPGCRQRLEIWQARILNKLYEHGHAQALLDKYPSDREAMAFLAETYIETDEPEKALKLIAAAIDGYRPRKAHYPEKPLFGSGYELIEDRAIGTDERENAFSLFLISTQAEIKRRLGLAREASEELYRLTRELKPSENDPNLHVYLYLYFLSIPESGQMSRDLSGFQTDRATILSKAFKYLQLRASRIDTAADKNSFMSANRINRMLLDSAKLYKFI